MKTSSWGPFPKENLAALSGDVDLYWLKDMGKQELDAVLPSIDCILVHFWPKELDSGRLARMTRLVFIQSALAGVNHIPFRELSPERDCEQQCRGLLGRSGRVRWGLVLSAAKEDSQD